MTLAEFLTVLLAFGGLALGVRSYFRDQRRDREALKVDAERFEFENESTKRTSRLRANCSTSRHDVISGNSKRDVSHKPLVKKPTRGSSLRSSQSVSHIATPPTRGHEFLRRTRAGRSLETSGLKSGALETKVTRR